MKKMILIFAVLLCNSTLAKDLSPKDSRFTTALTSGAVLMLDRGRDTLHAFNVLTIDGCYNFSRHLGVGTKLSFWFSSDESHPNHIHVMYQLPWTVYMRTFSNFQNGLRLYGSLGLGPDFLQSSCFGSAICPLAEAEVGLNYSVHHRVNFTTACRYIFPHNALDLRLGVAFEI